MMNRFGFRSGVCSSLRRRGEGGFTLFELVAISGLLGVIGAALWPSLNTTRKAINEANAISTMRDIGTAQDIYFSRTTPATYAKNLAQLVSGPGTQGVSLIDPVLVGGQKGGYEFTMRGSATGWAAFGQPLVPGDTGCRYFFIDSSRVLRESYKGPAGTTAAEEGTGTPGKKTSADKQKKKFDQATLKLLKKFVKVDAGGGEPLVSATQALLSDPDNVLLLQQALDSNGDNELNTFEVLGADLLSLSRELVPVLFGDDPGPAIGEDAELDKQITRYFEKITDRSGPEASEICAEPPAGIPADILAEGDPVEYLEPLAD